ncbi:hypothetical protein J4H86_05445 [Spiractinospora alimapuensis]|uniref:hypothetical protein n=1 Tax=Spiractinospora alimapuensis TaxID=2820884 RepID=UPI001F23C2E7|nr:hypothetical protein [Spiractinospora alimapuensis]QVQ53225.1 hypothetical protein J4H86_05445 [Spiractinospora alimapuensis]
MTNRRGNGLLADSYAPLAAVSARRADRLLVALREAGIAAYALSVAVDEGDLLTDSGEATLQRDEAPETTADHVYVDAEEHTRAVDVLRHETDPPTTAVDDGSGDDTEASLDPNGPTPDDEPAGSDPQGSREPGTEWDDLVARFYEDDRDGGSWPDAENVGGSDRTSDAADHGGRATGIAGLVFADRILGSGPKDNDSEKDTPDQENPADEGHYVPPPPPPFPTGTPAGRLAWTGVLGGPALVLVMVMLGRYVPGWLLFCVLVGFIVGMVVLIIRMPDRPPRRSDPDDGAIT